MNEATWKQVDSYLAAALVPAEAVLESALAANAQAGLPAIDVSPVQGKFLFLLAQMLSARRILEIGTLGGYSTIWLARALPADGLVVTLEYEPRHAEVARTNLARAGFEKKVRIVVGKALETLPQVAAEYREPFDLVFIDADKINTPEYFEWAMRLSRPGTVIVVDNVVRKGEVANAASSDASVQGMRRLVAALANDRRIDATGLQTVGTKGYDGFIVVRVH